MSRLPIVPAVIPSSAAEVIELANVLRFSHEFHLDVVDGTFVPTCSWPYEPKGEPLMVKSSLDHYTLEVDLMVAQPLTAAAQWIVAGADMLVFHVETLSLEQFKNFAEHAAVSVGISAHGDTTLEALAKYAQYADYVQLMGIRMIGAQGQPFDEGIFEKIAFMKEQFPKLSITIDGSVNQETIMRLAHAGADRFIAGSAIVQAPDPEAAYQALQALIN